MNYEHPLAYALGIEGVALLRAFAGEFDREFVEARIAEVRALLDDESLRAALPHGFQVRRCEEPRLPANPHPEAASTDPGPWEQWPWSLLLLVPEAAAAVNAGRPAAIVWHFQLAAAEGDCA